MTQLHDIVQRPQGRVVCRTCGDQYIATRVRVSTHRPVPWRIFPPGADVAYSPVAHDLRQAVFYPAPQRDVFADDFGLMLILLSHHSKTFLVRPVHEELWQAAATLSALASGDAGTLQGPWAGALLLLEHLG